MKIFCLFSETIPKKRISQRRFPNKIRLRYDLTPLVVLKFKKLFDNKEREI